VGILKRLLNARDIELDARVRPASVKMPVLLRHLRYFQLATYAVLSRKQYDAVFIWQQYVGLYYFLISIIFPLHRRPCCVYYIIFKSRPKSLAARIKRHLMIRMIHSEYVDKTIFLSQSDALYSEVRPEKVILLSTYTEKSSYIEERLVSESVRLSSDYFSGGTSNRDYSALKHLAERIVDKQFSVACLPKDVARISPFPKNMHIDYNAYDCAFEELILSAKAVILPLENPNVTSGQIVCLRAMQSAKPVFMTRNNFMEEWMPDIAALGFFFMYDELDELSTLLTRLTDGDLQELGHQARDYYLKHFDLESFYRGIADVIETHLLY